MTKADAKTKKAKSEARRLALDIHAGRVRACLPHGYAIEKPMFGGIGFMTRGNLLCCAGPERLMLRVGVDAEAAMMTWPGAAPLVAGGARRMPGYVMLPNETVMEEEALERAIATARAFVDGLPEKAAPKEKGDRQGRGV